MAPVSGLRLRRATLALASAAATFAATFTLMAQTPAPGQTPAAGAPAPAGAQGAAAPGGARGGRAGGGGQGRGNDLADFSPKQPYLPRTPADEGKGFMMPNG